MWYVLLQVIVVTAINVGFDLDHEYDVPTIGKIPKGYDNVINICMYVYMYAKVKKQGITIF